MKRIIFIFICIFGHLTLHSQTVIAKQSFEASGDTWTPLNFSTPPCTVGNDVWNYTTSFPSFIDPSEGAQFWGIRDLDGSCGGTGFETIIFPNVDVSSFSNVIFSFDYNAINFDNGEDLKYELFYDGVSQGEVIVVDGVGGNSDNTNGWLTETVSVPDAVNSLSVVLFAKCNRGGERAGFDNVFLKQVTLDDCAGAENLIVYDNGTSSGNETAANSATATASSMADTTCDTFTSNENLDLFYTFTVPVGATSINVLTAGANGATINVAAWTDCNGTEIFCDNTNSSFHEITGLTPGQTYILQVWHDDFNAGPFTIALEGPTPPPSNSGCTDSVTLNVGSTNTENVVTGTNEGALDSGELPNPSCALYGGRDVWFTAQIPSNGVLFVETQDAGSSIDTAMAIYTGNCGSLTQIACDDDSGPGLFSAITLTGLPNTTVYIRIYSWNNQSAGNFNIVAYSPECPFTTTWNGSSWNNGAPDAATSAVINGNYDTSTNGNFDACDCTVNAGATVNVRANNYISIENDLTVSGILEIRHEGSLVMIEDDGVITSSGVINVHKTSSLFNQFDYIYWSSPMTNETIGSALASSVANRIYRFDNLNGWFPVSGATNMEPAKGYIAMGPTTGSFPQNQAVVFDGLPNTGVVTSPIAKGPDPGLTSLDWNLIGNPYPSALDATKFIDDPLNTSVVSGTIYLWTHNTPPSESNPGPERYNYTKNDYASFTSGTGGIAAASGGAPPTGFVASGQGFFVQALSSNNATFNNSMRVNNNNNQFFKSKVSNEDKDRIWLNLYNDKGAFNQLLVGFIDGATDGIDRSFDGPKLGGNFVSFYSIIEGKHFAIQGKPSITDEETIKLGVSSYIDAGDSLKIGIEKLEGALANYGVYIKDKLLNVVHDLSIEDYTFIPEPESIYNDRFELLLTKSQEVLDTDDVESINNELLVLTSENEIEIKTSISSTISQLKIYDVLGKTIVNTEVNDTSYTFKTTNITKGTVLIINTTIADDTVFIKKILVH